MNFGHSGKSGKGGDFGKGYGKSMGKGSKGGKGFRENFEGNRYQRFNDLGKGSGFDDHGGFGSMGGGKGGNFNGGYSGYSGEQYGAIFSDAVTAVCFVSNYIHINCNNLRYYTPLMCLAEAVWGCGCRG